LLTEHMEKLSSEELGVLTMHVAAYFMGALAVLGCQGAEAFEIQHSDLANGIFMKFLKKRLLEDKKITVLLDQVAEDMGHCSLTKGVQALEICSSLSARRALTDPIQQKACSSESLARNLQWSNANELPESICIEFDCGVKIKLGFAAEFSNVMIIYTRIVSKPPNIMDCTASVTDFPLDLYVDPKETNKGTPEETGSFLVSKELPKHCLYTRLSSLQTLKENLTFMVCLNYMYEEFEDMVEEKKKIDVGKPLVAKLDIHSGLRSLCAQSGHLPHSPCRSPDPASAAHDSSRVFTQPRYPQPHHHVQYSHIRSGIQPESHHQDIYTAYPPNSRRRYFSENKSPCSNVTITGPRNIPEESTEENVDFGYHYKL
ncbi:PREDICTED: mucosa-associated lymphoid tissue lymphoma translocation protein 1 homolog, partial [Nanorana parkeri]|uniref:mucosa-associated lymphoid tissue lymphoma translocation protein 1 homolog n=1 Tax=Nanorana parkeri TaxID=125878 RepID=UPI000854B100